MTSSSARPGELLEHGLGVGVAGPEALEVQHPDAAQLAQLLGDGRRHDAVGRRRHDRQLEPEGVDLPGDVDVLGITGATARDDGDLVEAVGRGVPTCRCRSRRQPCWRTLRPGLGKAPSYSLGQPRAEQVRQRAREAADQLAGGLPGHEVAAVAQSERARRDRGTRRRPSGRSPGRSRGRRPVAGAARARRRCGRSGPARSGRPGRTRSRSRRTTPAACRRRRTARCGSRPGCPQGPPAGSPMNPPGWDQNRDV